MYDAAEKAHTHIPAYVSAPDPQELLEGAASADFGAERNKPLKASTNSARAFHAFFSRMRSRCEEFNSITAVRTRSSKDMAKSTTAGLSTTDSP